MCGHADEAHFCDLHVGWHLSLLHPEFNSHAVMLPHRSSFSLYRKISVVSALLPSFILNLDSCQINSWILAGGDGEAQQRREDDRRHKEAEEIDAEWAGQGGRPSEGWAGGAPQPKVPTQELSNLKPYDDDDYEEEEPTPEQRPRNAQVNPKP